MRQTTPTHRKKRREFWIAAVGVPLLLGLLSLLWPDVRKFMGLSKNEAQAPTQSISNQSNGSNNPANLSANGNATGNSVGSGNVAGSGNVVGNNNTVNVLPSKPEKTTKKLKNEASHVQVNAPNGFAINGGVVNNPTINNLGPSRESGAAFYDLTTEQRDRFVKMLSAQTAPKDLIRIGCTSWSETSCVAAGEFLLMFSEAGWQIEADKVFRLEPQIPLVGVSLVSRTPPGEPTEKLPPHLGRWRAMDESRQTVFWAFRALNIPINGATDDSLQNNALGIYFGPVSK